MLCIHLSGNHNAVHDSKMRAWLAARIKTRQPEDMERFVNIRDKVKSIVKDLPPNMLDGIKSKVEKELDMRVQKENPISNFDSLIFQRQLGHKEDMPGSGMWYETSSIVNTNSHYKYNCW